MANKKLQKRKFDAENVLFLEMFPELTKTKTQNRALTILEAAIRLYREEGIENTTYERIAKVAKISRPLIFQYFSDYDDLFYKAMKFIRVQFQFFAVEAIKKAPNNPKDRFIAYVESTSDWCEQFPNYASGLLLYLQKSSCVDRDRDFNTQFSEAGAERIATLIEEGVAAGQFQVEDARTTAKQVQIMIAGCVVTQLTENVPNKKTYRASVLIVCLALVGSKSSV